jgi:hypothetical protein
MSLRKSLIVVAAWTIFVSIVSILASAQVLRVEPQTPMVLSGNDMGFRVTGARAGKPVGQIVVKVNGQWVEAELYDPSLKRLTN